ncbi:MAG: cysteine--tRNA ligase [Alphaproteobacteria bacterium]|nr:cysteine--tRNA ligase [Alphaproteobacteria bacterium]
MTLRLYNTRTRKKEAFSPIDPNHVRMYVCGPTVYDRAHVGNARPVVVFDVLYRVLRRLYPKVTYVRNITDVDDKIIAAAGENGEPIDVLTARTTAAYHADVAELGVLEPDVEPRATGHIAEMTALIEALIAKGHAYAAEGHVLFDVPSYADYGALSRRSQDEMIAGARVEVAPYKRNPADFVLWKPSTPEQPGWDSPLGRGRPGWHIECSAMAEKHLGEHFDIHGGGLDLIFPHHENEIAQSVCAHDGRPFANVWMHNGFLVVEGEKMSKSLGNFRTMREALEAGHRGETIRYFLLSAHYRQPLDWTETGLAQAKGSLDYLYGALRASGDMTPAATIDPAVEDALMDDLNTPLALGRLHALAGDVHQGRGGAVNLLLASAAVLGLAQGSPEAWFKGGGIVVTPVPATARVGVSNPTVLIGYSPEGIERLIEARMTARNARNFAEADRIREELAMHGVILEDRPGGRTDWRRG